MGVEAEEVGGVEDGEALDTERCEASRCASAESACPSRGEDSGVEAPGRCESTRQARCACPIRTDDAQAEVSANYDN